MFSGTSECDFMCLYYILSFMSINRSKADLSTSSGIYSSWIFIFWLETLNISIVSKTELFKLFSIHKDDSFFTFENSSSYS